MLKNGPTITATVLLSGAAAAMIALSSPAFARGGGHHQGECGERYSGHECGHFEHGEHHLRGNHERPFEDYHRSGYQPGIEYPSYQRDNSGPSSSGVSPASGQPNPE
jgi:hypothetical protein